MSGPTEGDLNVTTPAAPSGKQNCVFQADSAFTDPITGLPERHVSCYPQPATASLEGTVKLAQDLAGTADAPNVVGLGGVPIVAGTPGDGYIPTYVAASSDIQWQPGGAVSSIAPWNNMLAPTTITPPVLGSLTWGNQGTATAAANAGNALYLVDGPGASSDQLRFLYKSAPATPYTLTIGLLIGPSVGATSSGGIYLRESSSGKLITFYVGAGGNTGGNASIGVAKYNSYTSFSASYIGSVSILSPVSWLRVTVDSTHITWYCSIDGQNFKQMLQKNKNDFFTTAPDQIGIGIDAFTASDPTDALFVHWAGI